MANIIISDVCNLKCPFCFAREYLDAAQHESAFIPLDVFEQRLDFLEHSDIQEIRLIGGEPTLHPHFREIVEMASARQKRLVVFSHGLIPERALVCLEALSPENCTVLVNTNASRNGYGPTEKEESQRTETIRRLGSKVLPGFTIYTPDFEMGFLLELIETTGCKKQIRVGLAQAVLSTTNQYLHPKQYPAVGQRLARFAELASSKAVRLELDCGFVLCMFSDDDRQILRSAGTNLESRCNPILDIGLDGRTIHCFPLTGRIESPPNHRMTAQELRKELSSKTRAYRTAGIYKECSDCQFKLNGSCSGGCLASTLLRFRPANLHLTIPIQVTEA